MEEYGGATSSLSSARFELIANQSERGSALLVKK